MNKKKKVRHSGKLKSYMQWPAVVAVLLVMLDILVFAIDVKAGCLVFCFTAAYWVLMSVLMLRYRPFVLREMIAFASQYSQIQKGMLKNFSIPYAVLDTDGRVLWMNDAFCDVTGKDSRYRKNISNLFPEIDASALPCKKEETDVQIFYNENDYQAHLQKLSMGDLNEEVSIVDIPQEGNYLIALYLFDNTELNYYIRQNQEQKMVAGLIYLDNYDEVLESVEEVRRSLLLALIDRKISKYVANLDGITKKLEKDKYFVVLKYKSLEELEANRFSLLEEVKTVNIGNEMKVTLSIGIGVNGSTYAQNYEFSRIAIELALGRGGDQAVVKDNDKISYYGGKSQQMEKSTRVKARVKAHALREFIGSHEDVVIMGHKITDIDSFGAAVGVWRAARILDKKAHIVLGDINGSIRQWVNLFLKDKENPEENDNKENSEHEDAADEINETENLQTNELDGIWKNQMLNNSNAVTYGNGVADIIDYAIIDEKGKLNFSISKGSNFSIRMKIQFYQDVKQPIFAYTLKDVKGTEITGTNTMLEKQTIDQVKAGEIVTVNFDQNMCLQSGNYLLALGCTGFENGNFTVYSRLYDVCNLQVVSDHDTVGYVDMGTKVTYL